MLICTECHGSVADLCHDHPAASLLHLPDPAPRGLHTDPRTDAEVAAGLLHDALIGVADAARDVASSRVGVSRDGFSKVGTTELSDLIYALHRWSNASEHALQTIADHALATAAEDRAQATADRWDAAERRNAGCASVGGV